MRHSKNQYREHESSPLRTQRDWGNRPGFSASYRAGTSYYPGAGDRNYAMGSTHEERAQNYGRPFSDFDRYQYQGENYHPWLASSETGFGPEQYGRHDYDNRHLRYDEQRIQSKGPKGYRRSDERVREDVCEALSRHSMIDASEVEVQISEGVVTLSGTVESRHMKRLIEDCAEEVFGVKDIKNEIKVESSRSSSTKMNKGEARRNLPLN